MNNVNEDGRSMIEMLGVLAIIGVLSVGGIAGYSKAMQRYRINKTIDQITYMAGAIRTFFAPQKSYDGLTVYDATGISVLKKAKLVPDDMWVEGENLPQSVWGNDVVVIGDVNFLISYDGIPEEACIELITYDWTAAGVTTIDLFGSAGEFATHPIIDLNLGQKMCSKSVIDNNYEFQLYFGNSFETGLDEL